MPRAGARPSRGPAAPVRGGCFAPASTAAIRAPAVPNPNPDPMPFGPAIVVFFAASIAAPRAAPEHRREPSEVRVGFPPR